MIDLHTHTCCSDGADSVETLLRRAEEQKLSVLSITDHNTVAAYRGRGILEYSGTLIPGVEITCMYQGEVVEVLGYGYRLEDMEAELSRHVLTFEEKQKREFELICAAFRRAGAVFDPAEISFDPTKESSRKAFLRHLNQFPENRRFFSSDETWQSSKAFTREEIYNPDSRLYVDEAPLYPDVRTAVEMIHRSGGIAFLAHLYIYAHAPEFRRRLWEIVREVRRHKRRAPKHMEEPGLFSGLVYCADCGGYLVLCRTEKMREEQYYFRCSTYGKKGKAFCTPHQILERDLKAIVLDDLKRVTHFARKKERQFAEYIQQKNSAQLRREISRLQKELDAGKKRCGELSALFKRLYEDNVLGRVTNEQFRMLSADYNAEQKALEEAIPRMEARLEELRASVANVEAFIEKAKRYTAIEELTPDLLRLFIRRIEIGERGKKYSRSSGQSVRIFYRDIGAVDSGMLEAEKPALSASLLNSESANIPQLQDIPA